MRSIPLAALSLLLPLGSEPAAHPLPVDGPGFEIRSTLQGSRFVTLVSAEGVVTTEYADSARPQLMRRQFIVRYQDQRLWGVDGEQRSFTRGTFAAQVERSRATLEHVARSSPPISGGTALPKPATLAVLPGHESIDGVPITPFALTMAGQRWRIWVAMSLPRPPAAMRAALASLVPADRSSAGVLAKIAGMPVVRSEIYLDGSWHPVMRTQSIKPVAVSSSAFAPPEGFREAAPRESRADSVGGTPGGYDVPAQVIRGPGPEMSNPELYVVFWGQQLNDPAHATARDELQASINDIVRPAYITPLRDYDIRSGTIKGFYSRPELPPSAIGSSNFAAISAMVYDVGFRDGAPIFWWAVGGHDPLYVLVVSSSEVDHGGWGGYHFVAFSLTHAVLPFPASLFAHDAIPWAIGKVPDGAMTMPFEGTLRREECARFRRDNPMLPWPAGIAAACNAMPGLDGGTQNLSHEIVEAASDPYVFLGWSDPGQQPFYTKSEISDICEFNPAPWDTQTIVGVTSVSTYWSNSAKACVPESRPTIQVFEPTAGQVITTATGAVVLHGYASDPVDGDVSDQITWEIDGALKGKGATVGSGVLAEGSHSLKATVRDTRGLERSSLLGFAVKRIPTTVTISSPADGDQVAAGHAIVLRGQAFVYQPGDIADNLLQWDDNGTVLGAGPTLFKPFSVVGSHPIRLSVLDAGGAITASSQVTIQVNPAAGRPQPSILITSPLANTAFQVPYGTSYSAPITFSATVVDATGNPVSLPVLWRSDVDGALGSGVTITHTLRGGYCSPFTHKITATAGGFGIGRASDTITLIVGQVC